MMHNNNSSAAVAHSAHPAPSLAGAAPAAVTPPPPSVPPDLTLGGSPSQAGVAGGVATAGVASPFNPVMMANETLCGPCPRGVMKKSGRALEEDDDGGRRSQRRRRDGE